VIESPALSVSQSTDSLLLDGKLSELSNLTAATARFCSENALADEAGFDLNLVIEELFMNAIRHGGCEGMAGAIQVNLRASRNGVAIEFADRGAPFDLTAAPAAQLDAPLEARQNGGLGIHLVRQIVRDLHYERVDGWNRLTMWRPNDGEEPE
jgi:anti-sigma regulatory factor (Ser/Thr protein kinase)